MISRFLIIIYTLLIFPWIFYELSKPKIDLLDNIGYELYSDVLLSFSFLPLIFTVIIFAINNKLKIINYNYKKKIPIIVFQFLLFLTLIYLIILVTIELPGASIKYYQFEKSDFTKLTELKMNFPEKVYYLSRDKLYYKKNDISIEKTIDELLLNNNIVIVKNRL